MILDQAIESPSDRTDGMVWIPGGMFRVGSDCFAYFKCNSRERPI